MIQSAVGLIQILKIAPGKVRNFLIAKSVKLQIEEICNL